MFTEKILEDILNDLMIDHDLKLNEDTIHAC